MPTTYNPISHFYCEHNKLDAIETANLETDGFGPVENNKATKYRTTSFVRTSAANKIFAICKGKILIQPTTGNSAKVNLILKPDASYSPIKIKYFIYRGVVKADLIFNAVLQPKDEKHPNQPLFLQKLWNQYKSFYLGGQTTTPPQTFPVDLIGFDPANQPNESLLDYYFHSDTYPGLVNGYTLPACIEGEHIGNFTDTLGLDIVLDNGDYKLDYQDELFKLDLAFARAAENVFDTSKITASTSTKIKRYKEYIHQFIDPAAFWGSHINCGEIRLFNDLNVITTNTPIFEKLLSKYQTKNKVYIYLQGERERSYNYYDATRKIKGLATSPVPNDTDGWPILIEDTPLSVSAGNISTVKIITQYKTDDRIDPVDRKVYVDVVSPNNDTTLYPSTPNVSAISTQVGHIITGDIDPIVIKLQVNNSKFCATFLMIYANLTQNYPLPEYFNQLWPVNYNTTLKLPAASPDLTYWANYDKNRLVDLTPQLNLGACIHNKVYVDTGVNGANASKERRLFIATLKKNTRHEAEFDKLNVSTLKSGLSTKKLVNETYAQNVYDDSNFAAYLGQIEDNSDSGNIFNVKALSLLHESDFEKKNSYFHLGITNEEYNRLIYNSNTGQATRLLPPDADKAFFNLLETSNPNTTPGVNINVLDKDFRKYKVGLTYEDNTGSIVGPLYPTSPANDVSVYTLDGYYFFSKDYAEYQAFHKTFANAKVEFRTQIPTSPGGNALYNGEFGFDWLRVGDNGYYSGGTVTRAEPSYQNTIVSGYHRPVDGDLSTEYQSAIVGVSAVSKMAFKALKREYRPIPTQHVDEQYHVQYLNLFSKPYSDSIRATLPSSVPAPPYSAELRVLVTIDQPLNKLEIEFDPVYFSINRSILRDRSVTAKNESIDKTIIITCLKDFTENKQIRVWAYPVGVTMKKDALLAGAIIMGRNDALYRKEMKFVFVNVTVQIKTPVPVPGSFSNDEIVNFYNTLYHNHIVPKVDTGTLNLSGNTDFQQQFSGSTPISRGFIDQFGGINKNHTITKETIHAFLRRTFLGMSGNSRFSNHYTIFSFGTYAHAKSTLGHVEAIGKRNIVMYVPVNAQGFTSPRDATTLNHETLHGFWLYHTHREKDSQGNLKRISEPFKKYVFPHALNPRPLNPLNATDNVMSYVSYGITTWQWQNIIVNSKIKQ